MSSQWRWQPEEVPLKQAQAQGRTSNPGCPPLDLWLRLCSGSLLGREALEHLRHASQCPQCAPLLAEARLCLSADVTPEEEAQLAGLGTSSPGVQLDLANRMHGNWLQSQRDQKVVAFRPRPRWSSPVFAWGALAACLLVAVLVFLFRPPSDAKLLAMAYNEQRSSEMRLPGASPEALVSPTRGSTAELESTHLLELKKRTQEDFKKRPNDPVVRQMLGRIALVQHDAETARRNFEMAEALSPNLPGLKFDLASAEFELAESGGQRLEYARAIDLYSQHLQLLHGNDPVALFNRGLCWERQGVTKEAVTDFEAALKLEKDAAWRREIEDHLARLKRSTTAENMPSPQQDSLRPADFLSGGPERAGQYEVFAGVAAREWLPRRGQEPVVDRALRKLAALGATHGDHWIEDMLRVPASEGNRAADTRLAQAIQASMTGNTDGAVTASGEAVRLYQATNNEPGYLRAAAEHVYSLQRAGQNKQCLQEAAALARHPDLARYAWMQSYLQLETGAALAMLGDAHGDRSTSAAAVASAHGAGLDLLALRGTSFVINDDVWLEHYQAAWEEATGALRSSDAVQAANMARYQLLYGLVEIAHALNLPWTEVGLADAAAATAQTTNNQLIAAYAMETLALRELQVGEIAAARDHFHAADALLATLGAGPAAKRYAADWKTDRALLEADHGGPQAGVAMLSREEAGYGTFDALEPRLHFYTEYADLLRRTNQTDQSEEKILHAITDAERQLGNVRSEQARQSWREQTRKAYEVLIADLVENKDDPGLSLRAWEWLQSAPYREQPHLAGEITREGLPGLLPQLPAANPGSVTLVFAKVLDNYIVWSLGPGGTQAVRVHRLGASGRSLQARADAFLRLCADPRSSATDINLLGQGLYGDLLAPFGEQIFQAHALRLDVDPSLAALPFAALVQDGRYLGLLHPLLFLPNWWTLRPQGAGGPDQDRLSPGSQLAILREPARSTAARIPEAYDESEGITQLFPHAQIEDARLSRDGPELTLAGASDLKAVVSRADLLHYVGHGLGDTSAPGTPAQVHPTFSLAANSMPHCRLAVLAACRTLRESEQTARDLPSFARVVLSAGAQKVMATQWDVDSAMTRRLMLRFYGGLAQGQTFDEALLRAQQSLQTDPAASHPYFWSGFQLVGQ